jgi:hypothetical protein
MLAYFVCNVCGAGVVSYPSPVSGRVSEATKAQIGCASTRFGPTESTIVRMALESFLPGYLAGLHNPEHTEFLNQVASVIDAHPELKARIEKILREVLRRAA